MSHDHDIDREKAAYLEGVRAGLEAAAARCEADARASGELSDYAEVEGRKADRHDFDCFEATALGLAAQIRALEPTSVSPAGALREKGLP